MKTYVLSYGLSGNRSWSVTLLVQSGHAGAYEEVDQISGWCLRKRNVQARWIWAAFQLADKWDLDTTEIENEQKGWQT